MRFFLLAFLLVLAAPLHADINDAWNWVEKQSDQAWHGTRSWGGHEMGYGDEARESFPCNNSTFFAIRQQDEASEQESWLLKGVLHTPEPGYQYQFSFMGVRGFEAFTALMVGRPIGRQPQPNNDLVVAIAQKFPLPKSVSVLHVRVTGLTPQPYDFMCDLSPAQMK